MKVKLCRKKKSLKSERTGKGQNRGKFITRRQTADAQRKRTVNNGPCLSWTVFTAPFVRGDIFGSLKRAEGSASRVFTGTGNADY